MTFGARQPREAARRSLADRFRQEGIDQPELDARILICAAEDISHAELICGPEIGLGAEGAAKLSEFAERRLLGEPVSRILGYREFWGLRFALTADVLDPRPDTETLVEAALAHMRQEPSRAWRILDLGVGSGAILGSLLRALPKALGVGLDISHKTCTVARENLASLGVLDRACLICGDWTKALIGRFDMIVSNPPYIERRLIGSLEREVKNYDPAAALDGGNDGLEAYRALAPMLGPHLAPGGLIALEAGIGQSQAIKAIFTESGLTEKGMARDLSGLERVVLFG